jgi:hypothetical protein
MCGWWDCVCSWWERALVVTVTAVAVGWGFVDSLPAAVLFALALVAFSATSWGIVGLRHVLSGLKTVESDPEVPATCVAAEAVAPEIMGAETFTSGAKPQPAEPDALELGTCYPRVLLTCRGDGVELRVESLGVEAANVQLVPAESENYRLRSKVIRYLRVGTSETLVLCCESKQKGASPILQAFSAPSLFFDDLCPSYEGQDTRGALEHALTLLTERQLAVNLELAYSNLSVTEHFRSAFLVRWEPLQEAIVDVEAKGIRRDANPPPSAPFNVISDGSAPQLQFQEWHGGTERSLPARWADGTPTWISVENQQAAPARTAKNVTGRMEFIDSQGRVRFVVPQVLWYQIERPKSGTEIKRWRRVVEIEGGDEQSFILFLQAGPRKLLIYADFDGLDGPIGEL